MTSILYPDLRPSISNVRAIVTTKWGKTGYRPLVIPSIESYYVDTALDTDADTWTCDIGDPYGDLIEMFERDSEVRFQLFGVGREGADYLVTGISDEISYNEQGIITLTGRDLSSLATDSAVPPQYFRHVRAWAVVEQQAKQLGFKSTNLSHGKIIKKLQLTDGNETYWEFWYRLYRKEKMWLWTEPNGILSANVLNYASGPSYFFGTPKESDTQYVKRIYIPVETVEIRKSTQQRVAEVWVYGQKGDNGFLTVAKDPTMNNWIKRPRKIMTDSNSHTAKGAMKTGWEEIFEGKVGSKEITVTIPDPGFMVRQNRVAHLRIPEIGLEGEYFIVGNRAQGGSNGFLQEIRLREKQYAITRRIPAEPTVSATQAPSKPGTAADLAGQISSVTENMPESWGPYFLKAAKEWHGPWDYQLFLATLIAIADKETGGTFMNERQNGGPGGDHHAWTPPPSAADRSETPKPKVIVPGSNPWSPGLTAPAPAPSNRAPLDAWRERFANELGDGIVSMEYGVGPMQLTDRGVKHWADDHFKAGARDEFVGGRWHPEHNIWAGARNLRTCLQGTSRDSGNDPDMWMGVMAYNRGVAGAISYFAAFTRISAYALDVKNKVYNDPGYLASVKSAVQTAQQDATAAEKDQPWSDVPSSEKSPNGFYIMPLSTKVNLNQSEFLIPDAEGAPDSSGRRYHAGKDWFAPAGSTVVSPQVGKIVEIQPSKGLSGQIFGGVVKVQMPNGNVWVFRHVIPKPDLKLNQRIQAGVPVANVARWSDNPSSSHCHIEFWVTLAGGYNLSNMRDPCKVLKD